MEFDDEYTLEEKRVIELTGDINLTETFKEECLERKIPILDAYNIQKTLRNEVIQGQIKGQYNVDRRLMELLEEKTIEEVSPDYIEYYNPQSSKEITTMLKKEKYSKEEIEDSSKPEEIKNSTDNDLLNKIILQNQKIIEQNRIIIDLLKKE